MSAGSDRNTTFNGLPNASLNITVDGVNNNSQRFKSGGTSFFQFAPTRIDAMEEVTVSTSGLGAESAGAGAMSIQMVTKRGTDRYSFRLLEQWHNEFLNANPYMTKRLRGIPVDPKTRQNYAVGSVGGPALPCNSYLKDKLFFFAYFEANPQPSTSPRSNTMLQDEVLTGNYTFIDKSGARKTLNVLDVARQNGFPYALDPTTKGMLERITATAIDARGDGIPAQTTVSFPADHALDLQPLHQQVLPDRSRGLPDHAGHLLARYLEVPALAVRRRTQLSRARTLRNSSGRTPARRTSGPSATRWIGRSRRRW